MRILLLSLLFVHQAYGVMLVAHKGTWKNHLYPQNTLASLELALDNGFEGVEFDVMMTLDHKLVLAHDDKLKRISNCKGKISETVWNELKKCLVDKNTLLPITQLSVKKVKNKKPFTSLNEVLKNLLSDERLKFVWIDFKLSTQTALIALFSELQSIEDQSLLDKILVGNASEDFLKRLRVRLPNLETSLEGNWGSEPLTDYDRYFGLHGITHDMISLNVGLFMGHEPLWKIFGRKKRFWKYLSAYFVEAKKRGIPTLGWTVNKKKKLRRLAKMGFSHLLTDLTSPINL